MGIIQSGFNQSITGLTFLAQQTPQWKAAAETSAIRSGVDKLKRQQKALVRETERNLAKDNTLSPDTKEHLIRTANDTYDFKITEYMEQNKQHFPKEYARNHIGAEIESARINAIEALSAENERAQATRDTMANIDRRFRTVDYE